MKRVVLIAAIVLFLTWIVVNFGRIAGDDDGIIRFVLGTFLALLILARWKNTQETPPVAEWPLLASGIGGAVLTVAGIIFRVHQIEWLGVILLLFACLRWTLPARFAGDIRLALFLLYWVHPLPGQVFASLTMGMQYLSVKGTEWLLQAANLRVWADGFILHAGYRAFGVPESCSGMRTSVTVLLCTLGVGVLLRLRWYETLTFLFLGLVQVLAFNIVRIAGMVYLAPRMPQEWATTFLHDTLGIFLLITLLIVQTEVSGWRLASDKRRRQKEAIERGERDQPDRATMLPHFWRLVYRWWLVTGVVIILAGLVGFAFYKYRSGHRAAMIKGVIEALMESDPEAAERAVTAAMKLAPRDRDLISDRMNVLCMRGKYAEALQVMDGMGGGLTTMETILKSWALMAMGRAEEAVKTVDSLPENARNLPGVAIIRAEYAALRDNAADVARNIVVAATRRSLIRRVRGLYPYLASREQWKAIADSDIQVPYTDVMHALISVHANLKIGNLPGAMRSLEESLKTWPNDPRFLPGLFEVAVNRPGGPWEERAAANFTANLSVLDAEKLASHMRDCFALHRPDLAWLAYLRLKAVDPDDPALFLTPARYAEVWFTFRRRQIGLKADDKDETVDLKPFQKLTSHIGRFGEAWKRVPLGDELARSSPDVVRSKYLSLCIAELDRREKAGKLSSRLQLMYPTALAMSGRFQEAHTRLVQIAERYPELAADLLYQHAVLYNQEQKWQEAYEALRQYMAQVEQPNLPAYLLMVNVLMNLNLGVAAMDVCEVAGQKFPASPQIRLATAGIWDVFGFQDQALFLLSKGRESDIDPRILTQLLRETGRVREAERISVARGLNAQGSTGAPAMPQPCLLTAAEATVLKRWPVPLTEAEMADEARLLPDVIKQATSPFVRCLESDMLEWLRSKGTAASSPEVWRTCGRDRLEQATALHRLAVVLARQKRYPEAQRAVEEAVGLMPQSAVLRRMAIALSDGDLKTVEAARLSCPDDPDVWLAWFVAKARAAGPGDWAKDEIRQASESGAFSVETFVRAGNFLLRTQMVAAASTAARYAQGRARGLVPADVLAIQCALSTNDLTWAMSAALQGSEHAADPGPFFETIVDIKTFGKSTDADMIGALEYLKERFSKDTQWGERLGLVYFQKRDTKRSLTVFEDILKGDIKKVRVESLILAAEAARLEGEDRKALTILENAYAVYPDNIVILNNLVYNLAQDPKLLPRARELLPRLVEKGSGSFAVLDTAAMVYLKSGDLDKAKELMDKALLKLDEKDYSALEATLNSAQILFRLGKYDEARTILDKIRRDPARSSVVDLAARDLQAQIREKTRKR